jgi:hypothetical protein
MEKPRRRGRCEECGDVDVTMATKTCCYRCYMRIRREQESPDVDRHSAAVRKEHITLLHAHTKQMEVFKAIQANDDTIDEVMRILRPYFLPIANRVNLETHPAVTLERVFTKDDPEIEDED